jgi:hypothetical protein
MLRACILAVVLCTTVLAGEAEPAKLPSAAQAALDRLAKAEAKIETDAAKARSTERQKAIKELEKAQTTATKAGDLDGAVAVKARVDDLKKAEEDAADLLGDARPAGKDPAVLALGSWSAVKTNGTTGTVDIAADKTVRITAGMQTFSGVWRIEKDRLVINWGGSAQYFENLAFTSPDRLVGDSFDAGKDGMTLTRQKVRN